MKSDAQNSSAPTDATHDSPVLASLTKTRTLDDADRRAFRAALMQLGGAALDLADKVIALPADCDLKLVITINAVPSATGADLSRAVEGLSSRDPLLRTGGT